MEKMENSSDFILLLCLHSLSPSYNFAIHIIYICEILRYKKAFFMAAMKLWAVCGEGEGSLTSNSLESHVAHQTSLAARLLFKYQRERTRRRYRWVLDNLFCVVCISRDDLTPQQSPQFTVSRHHLPAKLSQTSRLYHSRKMKWNFVFKFSCTHRRTMRFFMLFFFRNSNSANSLSRVCRL